MNDLVLGCIIHPIRRLKSSDWLKEGHMILIIFDNVHVWKLIHVCYYLLYTSSEDSHHLIGWKSGHNFDCARYNDCAPGHR